MLRTVKSIHENKTKQKGHVFFFDSHIFSYISASFLHHRHIAPSHWSRPFAWIPEHSAPRGPVESYQWCVFGGNMYVWVICIYISMCLFIDVLNITAVICSTFYKIIGLWYCEIQVTSVRHAPASLKKKKKKNYKQLCIASVFSVNRWEWVVNVGMRGLPESNKLGGFWRYIFYSLNFMC